MLNTSLLFRTETVETHFLNELSRRREHLNVFVLGSWFLGGTNLYRVCTLSIACWFFFHSLWIVLFCCRSFASSRRGLSCGSSRRGAIFIINLERVAIGEEAVDGVITSEQDSVRDPSCRQRSFFPDAGVTLLKDAVAAADRVIMSEEYDPWSVFGDRCNQQVVSDLQSCPEKAVVWRKMSRDTSEPCFWAQRAH